MKSSTEEILPLIGTAMAGGYYAGRIRLDDGTVYALIVAPKAEGENETAWGAANKDLLDALSYNDGLVNTLALAEVGSKLAQWARGLRIGGHDDWYLPSQDELEVIYRHLKPGTTRNYCYARSGVNLSAVVPTRPYTPGFPAQTLAEAFREEGAEAFELDWYWSSTQHAAAASFAWSQYFNYGYQSLTRKGAALRARAVRRLPL